MIVFPDRVRRQWPGVLCGGLLTALLPVGASPVMAADVDFPRLAQVGPPIKLAPPAEAPEVRSSPEPQIQYRDDTGSNDVRARVEVDSLSALDTDSVGLLDESQGGFGVTLWEGTDRRTVEMLLPKVPAVTESRISRALLTRLLLSRATAPKGPPGGQSLLALRVNQLLAAGEVKSAVNLFRISSAERGNETITRSEVESLFFDNDNSGACAKVRSLIVHHKGKYWQQANALCLALAGEHAKSAMISELLRERESDVGPVFFALVDALAGDRSAIVKSLPDPLGLQLAMMRVASMKLPGDIVTSHRPAVLRAVAFSPNAALELRLEAAERAMMMGTLSPSDLMELYSAVSFSPAQLSNPLASAAEIWGPKGRALLLRDAGSRNQPTARAEALRQAFGLSREKGAHEVLAYASLPVLKTIEPAPELIWFARSAASVLFAAGESERAMAWVNLARQQSPSSDEAKSASSALWPLAILVDQSGVVEWDPERLAAWWNTQQKEAEDIARARALMLYSLLESLGRPVGPRHWASLISGSGPVAAEIPDAALRQALRAAAEGSRLGETVLLSLIALGDKGPRKASPLTAGAVVTALRTVGLEREARAVALEAAIGAGL